MAKILQGGSEDVDFLMKLHDASISDDVAVATAARMQKACMAVIASATQEEIDRIRDSGFPSGNAEYFKKAMTGIIMFNANAIYTQLNLFFGPAAGDMSEEFLASVAKSLKVLAEEVES